MKLQHFVDRGKQKTKKSAKLYEFPSKERANIKCRNNISEETSASNQEHYFSCIIKDRDEGYTNWYIPAGDHCIIGDTKQIMRLANYLMRSCHKKIETMGISDFFQSKSSLYFCNQGVRLVMVDISRTLPEYVARAVSKCSNLFIYRPEKLIIYCPNTDKYRVSGNAKALACGIATGIGMDVTQLLDFICGVPEEEFLEISVETGDKWVRKLPSREELQMMDSINKKASKRK